MNCPIDSNVTIYLRGKAHWLNGKNRIWKLQCKKKMIREKSLQSTINKSWVPPFTKHDICHKKRKNRPNLVPCFLKQQHHIQSSATCINASCTPADLDFFIFSIALCMSSCLIGRMKSSTGLSWDGKKLITEHRKCKFSQDYFVK